MAARTSPATEADREEPVARRDLSPGLEGTHGGGVDLPELHREAVRRPARPARGGHSVVPAVGQAPDLRVDLLSRAQARKRRAHRACRHARHRDGRGRHRRRRAPGRRARHRDRVPADELSHAPRSDRARRAVAPRVLGRRTERVSRHHRSALPELLHHVRTRHQRRRDRLDAGTPGRVRGARGAAHDAQRRHRGRGEAELGERVRPLAAVDRAQDRLDGEQQLLQDKEREDRHAVAVQPARVLGDDEVARSLVRDHTEASMTTIYWDPLTPELRDDPYPLWRRMRDEAPVYYNDRLDFFALSRFDDVEAANRDADTYSSNHGTTLETMSPEPVDTGMIIWLDPPKHTMLRKLVSRAFTPRRVSMLEDRIRQVCARLLDAQVGAGRFDYVQEFSAVLPPLVISSLLGVPESEQADMRRFVDDIFHIEEGVGMANEVSMNALAGL